MLCGVYMTYQTVVTLVIILSNLISSNRTIGMSDIWQREKRALSRYFVGGLEQLLF